MRKYLLCLQLTCQISKDFNPFEVQAPVQVGWRHVACKWHIWRGPYFKTERGRRTSSKPQTFATCPLAFGVTRTCYHFYSLLFPLSPFSCPCSRSNCNKSKLRQMKFEKYLPLVAHNKLKFCRGRIPCARL